MALHLPTEPTGAGPHQDELVQQEEPGFPKFQKLPVEIQIQVFTEALGKPNIQIITNPKVEKRHGMWSLKFHPERKSKDVSGYRRLMTLSLVNRTAYAAVRLATSRNTVRLPFKNLNTRIDASQDLVFITLPIAPTTHVGYYHPDHQFVGNMVFDQARQSDAFRGIQKVALKYDERQVECHNLGRAGHHAFFHCPPVEIVRSFAHGDRKMCSNELCGFLNCFDDLREVYLIIDPPRRNTNERAHLDEYVNNYYSLPSASPLRRRLSVFHGTGVSYIEHNEALTYGFGYSYIGEPLALGRFRNWLAQGAAKVLYELRARSFLLEGDKRQIPQHERDRRAALYRLPRARREQLVFKVLVAVRDDEKAGWEGKRREIFLAEMKRLGHVL